MSPIPAQRFTRKQIRLYSGEHELPDGTTLQELHIEHLSRIIMRNDGEEVVRDGEQSKDGEEVVCDEAVGNPLTRGGVAPPEESPPHQEKRSGRRERRKRREGKRREEEREETREEKRREEKRREEREREHDLIPPITHLVTD